MTSTAEQIVRYYRGDWSASSSQGNIPGEGHSRDDRSVSVKDAPNRPDGILVCVRGSGDWKAEMDRFRRDGLLPEFQPEKAEWRQVGAWEFVDEDGAVLSREVRLECPGRKKQYRPQHPDGRGGWRNGVNDVRRVLLRLPEMMAAPKDQPIFLTEGARKAAKLEGWGLLSTACMFGAKGWRREYAETLAGKTVIILPDNDDEGREFSERARADIERAGGTVRIIELPGLPPKGDIIDWNGSKKDLLALVENANEPKLEPLPGLCGPETWEGATAPARSFVVPQWVARGAAGLLGGEDGVGKSLLAQQLATCAASGVDFLGLEIERCRTFYLTCEDDQHELHRRQEGLNRTLGLDMTALKGWLQCVSLKGEIGNELATFTSDGRMSPTARYEQIRAAVLAFGAQLVFIDNAAHVFAGNENARHDVAAFLGLLERLSIEIDGAVILLAHPNKQHSQGNKQGNEYSGTTGWSAHVRNRLFLDWEGGDAPNPDGRVLRRSKANYARKGEEIEFVWHDWSFTRLDDMEPSLASQIREVARAGAENDAFLTCLAACSEKRRAVSHNPGTNYAPKIFAGLPEGKNLSVKAYAAAMERLLHLGKIELDAPLWQDAHRHWKQGIRAVEKCGDPPAGTPCGDLRRPHAETPGNTCGDPRAATPLNTNVLTGAAQGAAAPCVEGADEDFLSWTEERR